MCSCITITICRHWIIYQYRPQKFSIGKATEYQPSKHWLILQINGGESCHKGCFNLRDSVGTGGLLV